MAEVADLTSFEYFAALVGRHELLSADEERALSMRVRAGLDAQRRLDVGERRIALRRIVREGLAARNELVEANQRLVLKHARRFLGGRVELLDLVQEGNVALIRAAEKFDGRKGFRFSTYADTWIAAYMAICSAETHSAIRIPKKVYSNIDKVERASERVLQRLGRAPTDAEVAAECGLTPQEVSATRRLVQVTSLNAELGDATEHALIELVADARAVDPCDYAIQADDTRLVRRAVALLPPRERSVISLRHGLGGLEPESRRRVAEILGLPHSDALAAEVAATAQMRSTLAGVTSIVAS